MSSFIKSIRSEKNQVQIQPAKPASIDKMKDDDQSWKCRSSEVRKKRLRRFAHNQFFFAKRNAYKAQCSPKYIVNKRNKLLVEARLLNIHEIQVKNEKKIKKDLHIKQKGEFLKNILKINKLELISRGDKAVRQVVKKETVKTRENLKIKESRFQKFKDDKLLVASENTKRNVSYIQKAERFIKEMIENLRLKGIKKLNIDLVNNHGGLEKGFTIDVEKREILVKNSEVIRHFVKKSNYSNYIGRLFGKKENPSIENPPEFEARINKPSETILKAKFKIELDKKEQLDNVVKFDSDIDSPNKVKIESSKSIICMRKSLKTTKFSKFESISELKPKSNIQIGSSPTIKASSQINNLSKVEPKSLANSLLTGNQILKAKAVDALKKSTLLKEKSDNLTSLKKLPTAKNAKILGERVVAKKMNLNKASEKEKISSPKSNEPNKLLSKHTLDFNEKAKTIILKKLDSKENPSIEKVSNVDFPEDQKQNQEQKSTPVKCFPKAVAVKSQVLKKPNLIKNALTKQLGGVKLMNIAKKKVIEFPQALKAKVITKSIPNTLKDDNNFFVNDTNKFWTRRIYDIYRRMKGECSQASNISKKYLKRERRRLNIYSEAEKRRIKIYTKLRMINEKSSKGRRLTKLLLRSRFLKRYGIPALKSYSYKITSLAISSEVDESYLIQKFSSKFTNKPYIEYILENTNSYVFGIHKHHELLSIARNSFNEEVQSYRTNKLSKYALPTKVNNLEQFVEEVMGEMIINGDLKQESRENKLENNIMRLRYLVNSDMEEKQTLSSCKNNKSDEVNQLWDKLVSNIDLSYDHNSNKVTSSENYWKKAYKFIFDEEVDFFKKVYYLSDFQNLENFDNNDSVIQNKLKSIRVSYYSEDFKPPFIYSKEIKYPSNSKYYRRDFISYVGKLSPWTKIALIQKKKKRK